MKTLIKNTTAITLDDENSILSNCEIAIDDKLIITVGKTAPDFSPDEVIDGTDKVALPAFFNAHTHSAMTLERGWAEDMPFDRWLNEKIWVAESALEEEDVYWGSALAAAEMIRGGIVGFADHYFWMDQTARVVEESGMKALLAWCHFGIGDDREPGGKSFVDTVSFVQHWKNAAEGRIHTTMGPHSPYMDPPEVLWKFAAEAHRLGVGAHFHLSESQDQVDKCLQKYGKTPVEHVESLGLFDLPAPTIAAHCVAPTKHDLEILAAHPSVYVAQTPKTYQKLGMGMPPLLDMDAHGVRTAFGTDGPASNSDLNILEILRIAGGFYKQQSANPEVLPKFKLLRKATTMSSAAMGFNNSGVLSTGKCADLILLNTDSPNWFPRHDLAAGVVYTAHPSDVSHVWSDGRLLYKNGEFMKLDIEKIKREAEHRAFRMVGKPMSTMRTYSS
jgi:5-methylthioadenosine/S-adenosylhomocysteine deaminase